VSKTPEYTSRGGDVVHRQRGAEPGEPVRVRPHQFGQFVVGGTGEVKRGRRAAEFLKGRDRQRQHLAVVAEGVHHPPAGVQAGECGVLVDPGLVAEDPLADGAA
jgi:hypothetical protein